MIATLTGRVVAASKDSLVIDVRGVGFQVFVPESLRVGPVGYGPEVTVYTHLHVRDNELSLYGFGTEEELGLFRLLMTVQGIGPKVALALLSALSTQQLQAALAREDVEVLTRVPGIGPKTAKKLAFELKDKVAIESAAIEEEPEAVEEDVDVIAALTTLGYSTSEAQEAIRSLPPEPLPLEERVRLALLHFAS